MALRPSQLVEPDANLIVDEGPRYVSRGGTKLENALEALGDRRRRPRLPRRRRLHRRLHRLPAAARRRAGDRRRRRLRPARRAPARGPARARDRAPQRPGAASRPTCPSCPRWRRSTSPSSRWPRCCRRWPAAWSPAARCWRWSSRSSSSASERVGRGVVRDAADRREAILGVAAAARELGLPVRGFASSGLPGPKGNRETFVWCGGGGAGGRGPRGGRRRRGRGGRVKTAALITHSHPPSASEAVAIAAEVAAGRSAGGWRRPRTSCESTAPPARASTSPPNTRVPDICLVLGGDGSILHALRRYAHTEVPVFGVNFGTVGFLAAVERDQAAEGIRRALEGEIETIQLPGLEVKVDGRRRRSGSTTSPSPAAPTTASPSSATGSPARRSATSAATASSPPPRSARPATTSPTRDRSWPGA